MRVAIVAEFYPRAHDPVLGVWAHRQALAARDAGADVRVLVLNRVRDLATLRQPSHLQLDGVDVRYLRYASPPRSWSYGTWGAFAAGAVRGALAGLDVDLVHAHYGVPAGDAVRRASTRPLVVSSHGGDTFFTAPRSEAGRRNVEAAYAAARLVIANSAATARQCEELGARTTRVVHLGTDIPAEPAVRDELPTVVTVAHLVARKHHADVLRAVARLPGVRYRIVGDGPERAALVRLASELGIADRVEFTGQLPPAEARRAAQSAHVFALPSVDEAFGVAYIEAMAGGVPAIGCAGEGGPEEIAVFGGGMALVPAGDVEALSRAIDGLRRDPDAGAAARRTVESHFTWDRCGRATVAAYEEALG